MAPLYSDPARPAPRDISHYFSSVAINRKPSKMKAMYKYFQIPGVRNIAGGMPNYNHFPFETLESAAALPNRFQPTPRLPIGPGDLGPRNRSEAEKMLSAPVPGAKDGDIAACPEAIVVPRVSATEDTNIRVDVKTALQYGSAQGFSPLYSFLRRLTRDVLHPYTPYRDGPEIVLTSGNTDGFSKTVEAITDPWIEGKHPVSLRQAMLCEEFVYPTSLQAVRPRGINVVPVAVDRQGMKGTGPGGLEDVLKNWNFAKGMRPHFMYTITMGQNPTGGLLGIERRKELYAICVEYDVLIIEDDPYWFLQYPSADPDAQIPQTNSVNPQDSTIEDQVHEQPAARARKPADSSGFEFLDSLVHSFLKVDTDGRVIRLDTFSKSIAPGCRLGWITAQPALIERILRITETTTMQPSGLVQALVARLILGGGNGYDDAKSSGGHSFSLDRKRKEQDGWKVEGWIRWLEGLRGVYERRMNLMCDILEKGQRCIILNDVFSADVRNSWSLVTMKQLFTFDRPRAGMFVWIRVNFDDHPLAAQLPLPRLSRAFWVFLTTEKYRVIVSPGVNFSADEDIAERRGWYFFRLCFAAVDLDEEIADAARCFVACIRDFWEKDELDDDDDDAGYHDSDLHAENDSNESRLQVLGLN